MLYVNGKYLNLNAPATEENKKYIEDYQKTTKRFKDMYGSVIEIKHKKYVNGPKKNPSGVAEAIPVSTIPLLCTYAGDNGTEEWAYSENAAKVKDGEVEINPRQKLVLNGEFYLDLNTQADLAYFLISKHPFFNGKKPKYLIHDKRQIARSKAEEYKRKSKVEHTIFGDTSPFANSLKEIKLVSKRWGIADVDNKEKETLQIELYDKIMDAENRLSSARDDRTRAGIRGIDAFLEDVKMKEDIHVGALAQEAIEKGIVTFNLVHHVWQITTDDGTAGDVLVTVPVQDVKIKEEVLISAINTDPRARARLEQAMGKKEASSADYITFTIQDIKDTDDWHYLQRSASQLGLKAMGLKKEALRDSILEEMHARQMQNA